VGCIFLSLMTKSWQCGNIKWNRYFCTIGCLGIARGDTTKKITKQFGLSPEEIAKRKRYNKSFVEKRTLVLTCCYNR
jgi:hypothetical protein